MIRGAWEWLTDWFCSQDRKPSFPKIMATAIYVAFVTGRGMPATVCAMLLAAAFGLKTFQMWLGKSTFAHTASDTVSLAYEKKVTEVVQARRDPTSGVEPAP